MRTALLLGISLLTACGGSGFRLITPAQHQFGAIVFNTTDDWNQIPLQYTPRGADAVWTRHGTNLDSLIVFSSIGDGDTLFPSPVSWRDMPRYRAGMLPPEIMDWTEVSFRLRLGEGNARVLASNLKLLPGNRFRFDMNHTAHNGFSIRGTVLGGVLRGRLWMLVYQAAEEHYFENSLPDIEALFVSVRPAI